MQDFRQYQHFIDPSNRFVKKCNRKRFYILHFTFYILHLHVMLCVKNSVERNKGKTRFIQGNSRSSNTKFIQFNLKLNHFKIQQFKGQP